MSMNLLIFTKYTLGIIGIVLAVLSFYFIESSNRLMEKRINDEGRNSFLRGREIFSFLFTKSSRINVKNLEVSTSKK